MLIVLSIVLMISFVGVKFSIQLSEKAMVDQFFHQLLLDIQMAQNIAMEEQRPCVVSFSNQNHYKIYYTLDEVVLERKFPPHVVLDTESSYLNVIRYGRNGETNLFGKVIFKTPFGKKTLVVYIGKGRVRYVE